MNQVDSDALDRLRIVLDPMGQAGVALALMLVMFGVALGLRVRDFRILIAEPSLYIGGVVAQVLLLPLVTFVLIHLISPPPSIALGMIVVACCPGGSMSNLLTYLARGDVAVSVALTATSSMMAALLTPVSTLFWAQAYEPTARLLESLAVSPLLFVGQTTLLLAIPLAAGMLLAAKAPDIAERIRKRTTVIGAAILGATIVYGIVYFYPVLWPAIGLLAGVTIVHNAAAFTTGAVAGFVLSKQFSVRRALTFEVGIQNSGLALIILLSQLKGVGGAAAIAAVWGVWHLIAGGLLAIAYNIVDRRRVDVVVE
ncbi:MAG: bile acid:sodium symporter family protein [Gammaproteobacteria bacterium]|nr:bile acid:sodium symporter family protein [Gammaproteobacteria bacterium]MDH5584138.1 bile acid:sodium symporter family protein [Gammaproteobacteria bacterium]